MNLHVLLCLIDVDLMSKQRVEFGWEWGGWSCPLWLVSGGRAAMENILDRFSDEP